MKIISYTKSPKWKQKLLTYFIHGIKNSGYSVESGKFDNGKIIPKRADCYIFHTCSPSWNTTLRDFLGDKPFCSYIIFDPHVRRDGYTRLKSKKNDYFSISKNTLRKDSKFFKAPPDRWNQLKKDYNIEVKPWRKKGDHIVIAYGTRQCPDDLTLNIGKLIKNTIRVAGSSDRKLVICCRPYKNIKKFSEQMKRLFPDIFFVCGSGIRYHLKNAHCMISYGGGSGVESIIAGVPSISISPSLSNFLIPNNGILKFIDDPPTPDRTKWFNWLGYQQWTGYEIKNGLPWRFLMDNKPFSKNGGWVL